MTNAFTEFNLTDYDLFYDTYIETAFNREVFVAYVSEKRLEFRPANAKDRARTNCFTSLACLLRHQKIGIRKNLTAGNIGHNESHFYIGKRGRVLHGISIPEKRIVLELRLNGKDYNSRILLRRTRNISEPVSEYQPVLNFPDLDYRIKSAERAKIFKQFLDHLGFNFK